MNTFFHSYGLMVGIGIISALQLIEIQAKKHHFSQSELWRIALWMLVGGVIGARLYHVLTDYEVYAVDLSRIFLVWEGGLSIIGGVIGGGVALGIYQWHTKKEITFFKTVADLAVFGLPFGQAVGRVGNFFNQELYGLPTSLPWGIPIDEQHRLPGYEMYARFHPLFFYEMIGTVVIGIFLWWAEKKKIWHIGSGKYALTYLMTYSLLRFVLDFLRIDKRLVPGMSLGTNQLVLLCVIILSVVVWKYNDAKK